ncbi:MAG TPA: pitrilysin family protein, partial [Povalibacter sp.]|nr:pitrilysin family protein [Povalibacter sp.]
MNASRIVGIVRSGFAALALFSACLLSSAWGAAADNGVRVPAFERVQLDNGAVLLLMERHDVPLIAFDAVMRGGAGTDPVDQSGMASLLASLLEKGAGNRDALAIANTLASVGGLLSATAGTESIVVSGSFLSRDQALMTELLADVLQRPQLAADQFDSVRARQIEFIRAAKDSELESLTPIYGKAALFSAHPYGKPAIGSEAGLAAITREALLRQYREQFGADRLVLAVVGDFRTATLKQLLTKALAGWQKAPATLAAATAPTRQVGRRVLLIDAPESVQSYFWAGNIGVEKTFP